MSTHIGPTDYQHLQEIVDFAIRREQEAMEFYNDLARKVTTGSIADELRRMAGMEAVHRDRLERLDVAAAAITPARGVADLKVADYTVAVEPSTEMTWQEIVNLAMHREAASMRLYSDMAGMVPDEGVRRLFENLAAEEAAHKLYFETIWDEEVLKEN